MADNTEFDALMRWLSAPDAISRFLDTPLPDTSSFQTFPEITTTAFDPNFLSTFHSPDPWKSPPGSPGPRPDSLHIRPGIHGGFSTFDGTQYASPIASSTTAVESAPSSSFSNLPPTPTRKRPRRPALPGTARLDWPYPAKFVCSHYPDGNPDIQRPDHHWKGCKDNPDCTLWVCPIQGCGSDPFTVKWNFKRHVRDVHRLSASDIDTILSTT